MPPPLLTLTFDLVRIINGDGRMDSGSLEADSQPMSFGLDWGRRPLVLLRFIVISLSVT